MSDENRTKQKGITRYLGWVSAALIGAIITLLVTEIYSSWNKRRELGNVEKQIQSEISTNLDAIDRKLWRLEPLGTYTDLGFGKRGDVGKFKSVAMISYTTDAYRRYNEQIDLLDNSDAIRRFYKWLDDSAQMQSLIASRFPPSLDNDILLDPKKRFQAFIYSVQRQGIYLYAYGCNLVREIRPSCIEKLGEIQREIRIMKKTPKPIIDTPSEKLQEFLTGWSKAIDASM